MTELADPLGARKSLATSRMTVAYYALDTLAGRSGVNLDRMPYTIKVLLENVLRNVNGRDITEEDVLALAQWGGSGAKPREVPFLPARVLL